MSLSIDQSIFGLFNETVDNIWSKKIVLYYPEKREICINCGFDGVRSNGVYKVGGPYPFDYGMICPYCDGEGYKMIEATEVIYARIYFGQKDWVNTGIPINIPNAKAQIISKSDDMTKLQIAKYIIPDYYSGTTKAEALKMLSDAYPFPQGFTQNPVKYFVSFWGAYG